MQRLSELDSTLVWVGCALLVFGLRVPISAGEPREPIACGEGVELRLSRWDPAQGSLLLLEVRSRRPVAALKARWAGQTLHFWQDSDLESSYQAFLGVDLQLEAKPHILALETTLEGGERLGCSAALSVQEGHFALQQLSVAQRFVDLSSKDLERARRESRRLKRIFASVTPERLWWGEFRLPLEGSEASGSFGRRRVLNGQPRSPHSGEDFPAPSGTAVRATNRGRVVLAEELFFSGNSVVLDHGFGLYSFYGHLESISVEAGRIVAAGDLLGRVGATGRVTGPHLHWATRLNAARVNPLDLLALFSP
ncbi:MAG: M23 family metallopeptidase [Acidobacteriota bacterium]